MRADRLLTIMLLLRGHGRMTAETLAQQLEVSERTIYRDLDALNVAGVPVYTQSGPNGGIFLDETYRMTLSGLDHAELRSLFVSSEPGPLHDLGLAVGQQLQRKLLTQVPSPQRADVTRLQQRFHIDPANWFQTPDQVEDLPLLQQAVWEDRQLTANYQPVEGPQQSYTFEPYALVAKATIWYLIAKRPDRDMRTYRAARLTQVQLLEEAFQRDPHFDLVRYWQAARESFEQHSRELSPPCPVRLRVDPALFWYFPGHLEGQYSVVAAPDLQGWTILDVHFFSLSEAHSRLLSLGAQVEVIEPVELQQMLIATARKIVERWST